MSTTANNRDATRDDLADVMRHATADLKGSVNLTLLMADAIVDAGYSKPRTVTTTEELEALPHHSLIQSAEGDHAERIIDKWITPGMDFRFSSADIALPALVLYAPEES